MMDKLIHWLQQVVAIIMFASIIDLLLPGPTMQKYVRFVVGLIVLVMLLKPIMAILGGKLDEQQLQKQWLNMTETTATTMPTLQQIQQNAEQLSQKRQQATEKVVTNWLAQKITETLQQQLHLSVDQVVVKSTHNTIETVTIFLAKATKQDDSSSFVQPVTIQITRENQQKSTNVEFANKQLTTRIQQRLELQFGIEPSVVTVYEKEG